MSSSKYASILAEALAEGLLRFTLGPKRPEWDLLSSFAKNEFGHFFDFLDREIPSSPTELVRAIVSVFCPKPKPKLPTESEIEEAIAAFVRFLISSIDGALKDLGNGDGSPPLEGVEEDDLDDIDDLIQEISVDLERLGSEQKKALDDLATSFLKLAPRLLSSKETMKFLATGQFPEFMKEIKKIEKAIEVLSRGFPALKQLLSVVEGLAIDYPLSMVVSAIVAKVIGPVTVPSDPTMGSKIETHIAEIGAGYARSNAKVLVNGTRVYQAPPAYQRLRDFAKPAQSGGDNSFQTLRLARGMLEGLTKSRRKLSKLFVRRTGSKRSREDIIVFDTFFPAGIGPKSSPLTAIFPTSRYPEFYEVKPVRSMTDAPGQVAFYVWNYAVARVLWKPSGPCKSPTPTLADPNGHTLKLPAVTGINLIQLGTPLLATYPYVQSMPPLLAVPFMVEGASGIIPYLIVDGNAAALAALAAAVAAAISEISAALKRQLDEIIKDWGRFVHWIADNLVKIVFVAILIVVVIVAAYAAASAAAAAALAALAEAFAAAAVVFLVGELIFRLVPPGKENKPPKSEGEVILTIRIGNISIIATAEQHKKIFAKTIELFHKYLDDVEKRYASGSPPEPATV
jgi:hypothetical protein